ncbi:MAG: hypothetical protein NTW16_19925 [Bacteroidetes bacterium]|nr:hypothetical protein [Bacteroidota bacterium]
MNTLVYSFPETTPSGGTASDGSVNMKKPFPNPAGEMVTIPYQLPVGVNSQLAQMSISLQVEGKWADSWLGCGKIMHN